MKYKLLEEKIKADIEVSQEKRKLYRLYSFLG